MTGLRSDLPPTGALDRAALDDASVVLILPVSGLDPWTVDRAWEIGRLAAANGRRVALMDLSLRDPILHAGAPDPPEQGLTDAFTRGVSISAVAQRYHRTSLYFLGTGARSDNPGQVWSSRRWDRLASGFAAEGALMLAFVPPQALTVLRLKPDAMVLLARPDYRLAADPSPGLRRMRELGVPVVGVLTRETPVVVPGSAPAPPAGGVQDRSSLGLRLAARRLGGWRPAPRSLALGAAGLAALFLLVFALTRSREPGPDATRLLLSGEGLAIPVQIGEADSVFYTVQVAAFNTLEQAMDLAAELDGDGLTTAVTPVRRGPHETWFRVQYGTLAHTVAADSTRRALWDDGRVERLQGTILRTPYALQLSPWMNRTRARDAAQGLRTRGVPAYVVEAPEGARVLFGAFEDPEQAGVAESLLTAANLEYSIVPRLGTAR